MQFSTNIEQVGHFTQTTSSLHNQRETAYLNEATMRSTTIIRGRFANGEGQKGNYTAYNTKNEQIFVHKSVMAEQGWKEDKDVPKQFYALIDERDIQTRDENGELTDVLVKRLSATAIFKDEADLINAVNSDARLEIAIKQDLKAIATSAGLTEASMRSLLEVAI